MSITLTPISTDRLYKKLRVRLKHTELGSLVVALYDDPQTPDLMINRLKQDLPEQFHFEIQMDSQKVWLPTFFSMNLELVGQRSNIYHVTGIDTLSPELLKSLFNYLQYGREQFYSLPYSLVFWLTEELEHDLFYQAPDFHHWVASSYDFRTETDVAAQLAALSENVQKQWDQTIERIRSFLQTTVHQYDHWPQTPQEDFAIDIMARADLKHYYVPMTYTDDEGQIRSLDHLLETFLYDPDTHFLALLGDFGIGKSSFSLQYYVQLARQYLAGEIDRIPIFVSLKDYGAGFHIETFMRRELQQRYGVDLPISFFTDLALQGKFIIFVDGFDEMTAAAGDETAIRNFEELTKLTFENILFLTEKIEADKKPNKVILTSRTHYFLSEEHEAEFIKTTRPRLYRKYTLKEDYHLTRVHLNEFDDAQVKTYVKKHASDDKEAADFVEIIRDTYNLHDLASRPLLLNMIVKALPKLQGQDQVNAAKLYKEYTNMWIQQEDDKSVLTPTGKRQVMWQLAKQVWDSGTDLAFHYNELDLRSLKNQPDIFKPGYSDCDPEQLRYDLTTCSFFNRDGAGNYKFIHKSFMEFFMAEQLAVQVSELESSLYFDSFEVRFFMDGLLREFSGALPDFLEKRGDDYVNTISGAEMCYVPPGPFLYGDDKTVINLKTGFFINKFPVTNADYRRFMEAGGYQNKDYWMAGGFGNTSTPRYWSDPKWKADTCPVVGVSWYEAMAYSAWAQGQLPHEQQWEKAARWIDGREYPWDDDAPTKELLNYDNNMGKTTPVDKYPNGKSPYGLWDCSGNVWEWCENVYQAKGSTRVLRGGAFNISRDYVRCADRSYSNPFNLNNLRGFRVCVLSMP